MHGTLIVTALGNPLSNQRRSDEAGEEDLYSIFLTRSMFMGWSRIGTSEHPPIPLFWEMSEAELSQDDGTQIGFVQVGLADRNEYHWTFDDDHPISDGPPPDVDLSKADWAPARRHVDEGPITEPVVAIPPLVRCVDDSLSWFGEVDVSAYEVTALDMERDQTSHLGDLHSVARWFSNDTGSPARAAVTLATGQRAERIAGDVFDELRWNSGRPFAFGPLVTSPEDCATGLDYWGVNWESAATGIEVSMPEWSGDAIGWVVARVVELLLRPESAPEHLSVRVARLPGAQQDH